MQQDNTEGKLLSWLHRIEDIIVSILLLSILLFSVSQIILRNYFDSGFIWGESFLRLLVLWLGLAGAILASRKEKQLNIDVLSQFIKEEYKHIFQKINFLFAGVICLIISYYSYLFIVLEYHDKTIAFSKVPAWLAESIIPIGFAIMAMKYFAKLMTKRKSC